MSKLMEKLAELSAGEKSSWMEEARYRRENRVWLKKSAVIALRVLDALGKQGLSQKDLAERLNVSPQQVSKIVGGQENLTLETIVNLEATLGIKIIDENSGQIGPRPGKKKPAA